MRVALPPPPEDCAGHGWLRRWPPWSPPAGRVRRWASARAGAARGRRPCGRELPRTSPPGPPSTPREPATGPAFADECHLDPLYAGRDDTRGLSGGGGPSSRRRGHADPELGVGRCAAPPAGPADRAAPPPPPPGPPAPRP